MRTLKLPKISTRLHMVKIDSGLVAWPPENICSPKGSMYSIIVHGDILVLVLVVQVEGKYMIIGYLDL